jgi:hypothetical protein
MPIKIRGELLLDSKREYTFEHPDSTFEAVKVRNRVRIKVLQRSSEFTNQNKAVRNPQFNNRQET